VALLFCQPLGWVGAATERAGNLAHEPRRWPSPVNLSGPLSGNKILYTRAPVPDFGPDFSWLLPQKLSKVCGLRGLRQPSRGERVLRAFHLSIPSSSFLFSLPTRAFSRRRLVGSGFPCTAGRRGPKLGDGLGQSTCLSASTCHCKL